MGKKANGKSFLQRMRYKYKIAILNENTLEEVWRARLSKMSVFLFCFLVAVIYFFLIAFLIIKTPLRGFLPGYTENIDLRDKLMKNSLTIDSLSEKMELQTQYMTAIRSVMSDEIKADSSSTIDSLKNKVVDFTTLNASQKEVTFRDSFEKSERLNINVLEADVSGNRNFLMKRPVNGVLMDSFNVQNKTYGVKIITEPNSNIFSILDGVVVESQFVLSNQYVISIQHADNMISVYKSKQPFLKKKGDRLRAGEIISTLRDSSERVVEFELWEEGVPLNPKEYISF